jgi:anti-sigma B factor antagonist
MATSPIVTLHAGTRPQELRLTRLPGEFGPILRCSGDLDETSVGLLSRELLLLMPMGHPVLTLNLSGCSFLDSDGVLTILQTFKRLREEGRRLVVVAGPGFAGDLLRWVGFDRVVPVFPTEEAAVLALRGGLPLAPPPSWAEARAQSVRHWRAILRALDETAPEEILRRLTSMTALCERSDEFFRLGLAVFADWPPRDEVAWAKGEGQGQIRTGAPARGAGPALMERPPTSRCEYCPLFAALGGVPEGVGCQSILDPIIEAVRAGDGHWARRQVTAVIRLLEALRLPAEEDPFTLETVVDVKS